MLLTVFTPTYNRAHTLERLYRSLCVQTCKDFEWLVIDDGSTDGTEELIEKFRLENLIPIRYIYKPNGGLYTGYNTAYANIDTELNVCVDSDDFMPPDAVEIIVGTWREKGSQRYAGITGLDFYAGTDRPIGGYFPAQMHEAYLLDLYIRNIHRGDSKQVMRTDLMKRVAPLEGFLGEKNLNPICLLLKACDDLPVILLNSNLCFVEYQTTDSMAASIWQQYYNSPRSFAAQRLLEMKLKRTTRLNNLRLSVHYIAASLIARDRHWFSYTPEKLKAIAAFPAGYLLYRYILFKNRKS